MKNIRIFTKIDDFKVFAYDHDIRKWDTESIKRAVDENDDYYKWNIDGKEYYGCDVYCMNEMYTILVSEDVATKL